MPLSASEASIEAELQTKGLNAPRLTTADIDAQIVGEQYYVFPGTTLTVCALTLRNGFIVTGTSAAASPENFDEAIGRRIARDEARNRIWSLEGYALRNRLSQQASSGQQASLNVRKRRYVTRLRAEGIRDDEPIDVERLMFGDAGTYDTVERRFLTEEELNDPEIRHAIASQSGLK